MQSKSLPLISAATVAHAKAVLTSFSITTAYLFGSQATGKVHPNSDVDFGVLAPKELPASLYFQLRLDLMDALGDVFQAISVDVVILNDPRVSTLLRFNAIQSGIVLLDYQSSVRKQFEFETMRDYYGQQHYQTVYGQVLHQSLLARRSG